MIRPQLFELADAKYQKFTSALIPNVDPALIIGVRLPELRKLAKQLTKGDWRNYLLQADSDYFEEVMLQGMVIGYAQADVEEILQASVDYIPKINNWSLCDGFCSGLKITKKYPERMWDFIQPYLKSDQPYELRFGVVMLLNYFIEDKYMISGLALLDNVKHEDYYVKMAVAWAISMCFVKLPEPTLRYLTGPHTLDDFTYNKALQKITESNRVDTDTKQRIRGMKRKRSSFVSINIANKSMLGGIE